MTALTTLPETSSKAGPNTGPKTGSSALDRLTARQAAICAAILAGAGWLAAYGGVYVEFAKGPWTLDQNAHAPFIMAIVLATAGARIIDRPMTPASPAQSVVGGAILLFGLVCLALARISETTVVASASQGVCALGLAVTFFGVAGARRLWFPIFLTGYLIIWPGWMVDAVTFPLKLFVSQSVSTMLYEAGLPVAHSGAVILAGPYQLLVADACAGLNSLIALTSVGAVYLYMAKRASLLANALVVVSLIPIAILANIIRVVMLVLITYYLGYDAGQSFLHDGAGLVMFAAALAGVFAVDALAAAVFLRHRTAP